MVLVVNSMLTEAILFQMLCHLTAPTLLRQLKVAAVPMSEMPWRNLDYSRARKLLSCPSILKSNKFRLFKSFSSLFGSLLHMGLPFLLPSNLRLPWEHSLHFGSLPPETCLWVPLETLKAVYMGLVFSTILRLPQKHSLFRSVC